jgi:hypothetical protein
VRTIRQAAVARVRATSLRETAREIGLSPNGLRGFLNGAVPYTQTLKKLRLWYFAIGSSKVTSEAASAAVAILLKDLPPSDQSHGQEVVLQALQQVYAGRRAGLPPWLIELLAPHPAPFDKALSAAIRG